MLRQVVAENIETARPTAQAAASGLGSRGLTAGLGVALALFTLAEVNYPRLSPQSQLAIFATLGLVLCFLTTPLHPRLAQRRLPRLLDRLLVLLTVLCGAYMVVQTEPAFQKFWLGGQSLGNRAGQEVALDYAVGVVGLLIVLEATRRAIGLTLPLLSLAFLAYAFWGPYLPSWLFPHRGYGLPRVVAQTYLHSQGVFGTALSVMFTYVFLFVLFGAFLEKTGATQFIIDFSRRVFKASPGGPAKVAVLSSGLMGSLSGSAVANTATTGTFTIPMMRSAGFPAHVAAGVEAAASSGGALMPPVMGAGAYMMLEIVDPPVTYLEIIRAAILPAILYYLAIFLIVHFYAARVGAPPTTQPTEARIRLPYEGVVFLGAFVSLVGFLVAGYTAFRAVTLSLLVIVGLALLHPRTRLTWRTAVAALVKGSKDVIALIAAAACVGIILGVVTLTGAGTQLPAAILPLAQENLFLALVLLMVSSLVLGMGLPSAVCYLLLATLIGPALGRLGVVPLAAHLFIFYFGMMSMVTPPVALAAYAASSIAGANILRSSFAAFRFALVGFTLPYMFVLRPELLLLDPDGGPAAWSAVVPVLAAAALGVVPLAAGIVGYLFAPLAGPPRWLLLTSAGLLLYPSPLIQVAGIPVPVLDVAGSALLAAVAFANWRRSRHA